MTESQIRCCPFSAAFDLNDEVLRGIELSFLQGYYRTQLTDPHDIGRFYPWEIFLASLPLTEMIPFLLVERYGFAPENLPEIVHQDPERVKARLSDVENRLLEQKHLQRADLKALPYYGFLAVPDGQHSSLSLIMQEMDKHRVPKGRRLLVAVILAGLLGGALLFALWSQA
jgi:hypothetical protein